MTSDLVEFYTKLVPQCQKLEKRGSYSYLTWTCKATGRPCSARECPVHTYLRDLIKAPVQAEPLQQAAELVVGTPGNASMLGDKPEAPSPGTVAAMYILPEINVINPQTEKTPELHIIHRKSSKTHSKPHVAADSVLKRALLTFTSRTGEARRWASDCVFSPRTRRPSVLEFQGKAQGKCVRFYFRLGTDDEIVKTVIGSWFANYLKVHDETALNASGSPTPFTINLLDET